MPDLVDLAGSWNSRLASRRILTDWDYATPAAEIASRARWPCPVANSRGGHVKRPSRYATTALALLAVIVPVDLRLHASGTLPHQAAVPATVVNATPKVDFEKYTLPNGLQVILHVDRKLPIVHVNQWFHVGSKNEK